MVGFPRYIRWTIALLPALVAPVFSLSILLSGLHQTAPAGSSKTPLPLRAAVTQAQSIPASDARPPVVTTKSEGQPDASVSSSLASTTDQFTLPETGFPTVGSIPEQFKLVTPAKIESPAATPVPTRKPVNTPTASAPREPAPVIRAANPAQPANMNEAGQAPESAKPAETDKTGEPDDKGKGHEPDDHGKDKDDK